MRPALQILVLAVAVGGHATVASADFLGVLLLDVTSTTNPPPGTTTWRVIAAFDDPLDQVRAVGTDPAISSLHFETTGCSLVNESLLSGTISEDTPQHPSVSAAYDSWLATGSADHLVDQTSFDPGFLGGAPGASVVHGSSFCQSLPGGYFDLDPTSNEGIGGEFIIAQFTVACDFRFRGTIFWADGPFPVGNEFRAAFFVESSSPACPPVSQPWQDCNGNGTHDICEGMMNNWVGADLAAWSDSVNWEHGVCGPTPSISRILINSSSVDNTAVMSSSSSVASCIVVGGNPSGLQKVTVEGGSVLTAMQSLNILADGQVLVDSSTVNVGIGAGVSGAVINDHHLKLVAGIVDVTDAQIGLVTNNDEICASFGSTIDGGLLNQAGAVVHGTGALTVTGNTVNLGVIDNNACTFLGPGGFTVIVGGDFTSTEPSSILIGSGEIEAHGDVVISIDAPARFDFASATLAINGGIVQEFEAIGPDFGPFVSITDPLVFPIGTFMVESGSTASVVDNIGNVDNDGVYVGNLVVETGATLQTNGIKVYYATATLDGTVDDLSNLIEIEACPADLDGDSSVGFNDLISLLSAWGPCGACSQDLNGDGDVGFADLLALLASWGPCA